MSSYWCFSVNCREMYKDNIVQIAECVKENHCIGVLQKAEISIFIFCDRKDKNTAMMKVKDLGIKSVHHAYLTDKQIERVEEYYSNIN